MITALLLALALAASACRLEGLAFREDNRLEIVRPKDRSEVSLPVTVRWVMGDIPEVRSFVVAVDRSPQPPGEGLHYFVRDDDGCRGSALPICLQPDQLAGRGVYTTHDSQITFEALQKRVGVSKSEEDRHEVTVALLDAAGRRIGESGWTVTFTARNA